jgi:phage terminase large subunit-like protein
MNYLENLSINQIVNYIDSRIESRNYEDLVRLSYYKPTPKMMSYYRAGLNARERLILGGVRTGKTYGILVEDYFHLTGLYPEPCENWPDGWPGYRFDRPINALEASVSAELTRDILQATLFRGSKDGTVPPIVPEGLIISKTGINLPGAFGTVTFPHVSGGYSTLYLKAFKQGASSFQGVKFDWIHLDESVGYDVYQEALMRTASFTETRTLLNVSMWPEKGMDETVCHFLQDQQIDGTVSHIEPETIHKNRFYMHIGWNDNPYLPQSEIERLEQSTPAWQLEARKEGIPLFGHGKVFIQPESEFVIPPFDLSDPKYSHFRYIYGLDPSVTSGGTYGFVLLAYDPNIDIIYACRDYKLSNVTPSEHASNIQRLLPFPGCPGKCDPAGVGENPHTKESTFNFLVNTSGLNLSKAIKVNGTKEAVIDAIYERIRRGTFKILYDASTNSGCVNLMKEWRRYSRDEKGQIIKKDDHCIDSGFYAFDGIKNAVSKGQNHYISRATHASRI